MGIFRAGMLRACGFQRCSKYSGSGRQLGGRLAGKILKFFILSKVVGLEEIDLQNTKRKKIGTRADLMSHLYLLNYEKKYSILLANHSLLI